MKASLSISAVVLLLAVGMGCAPVPSGESSTSASGSFPVPSGETLMTWADALAGEELARLAAAEMVYRNNTYEHALDTGDFNVQYLYGKYFRQFTGYEVVDVERTPSLLHPVLYKIRYDFDLLGTAPRIAKRDNIGLQDTARTDFVMLKDGSDSIVREYISGTDYRPKNDHSPFLERPNYWQYRTQTDLFGHTWSLRDVSTGP